MTQHMKSIAYGSPGFADTNPRTRSFCMPGRRWLFSLGTYPVLGPEAAHSPNRDKLKPH